MTAGTAPGEPGTWLAFDYGTRRIGIAGGEQLLGTARPLQAVANRHGQPDWQAIDALVADWQPVALVIGIPLRADGTEQPMTAEARGFGRRLRRRYSLSVFEMDERFSSMEAQQTLAGMRRRGQRNRRVERADIDAMAATVILERWFGAQSANKV